MVLINNLANQQVSYGARIGNQTKTEEQKAEEQKTIEEPIINVLTGRKVKLKMYQWDPSKKDWVCIGYKKVDLDKYQGDLSHMYSEWYNSDGTRYSGGSNNNPY